MTRFITRISDVILEPLPDGKRFRLVHDVTYEFEGESWTVPAGSTNDFASIPGIGRVFLPKWGRYGWAAILHDYLYSKEGPKLADDDAAARARADRIFLDFMKVRGTHLIHIALIYLSVRAFGWMFFKKS